MGFTYFLSLLASAPYEEPLFVKLCSPAHRRAAALALLSAQSSMDESSSSLASRSRSVSPLRSRQHNALLIGLSTGMFDANNPKVIKLRRLLQMFFPFFAVGIRWEVSVSSLLLCKLAIMGAIFSCNVLNDFMKHHLHLLDNTKWLATKKKIEIALES